MKTIEIYGRQVANTDGTLRDCIFCQRAKELLTKRGFPFVYFDITNDVERQDEFTQRTNGATTVPQIFVSIKRVGGFVDLAAADRSGALQQMIAGY